MSLTLFKPPMSVNIWPLLLGSWVNGLLGVSENHKTAFQFVEPSGLLISRSWLRIPIFFSVSNHHTLKFVFFILKVPPSLGFFQLKTMQNIFTTTKKKKISAFFSISRMAKKLSRNNFLSTCEKCVLKNCRIITIYDFKFEPKMPSNCLLWLFELRLQ